MSICLSLMASYSRASAVPIDIVMHLHMEVTNGFCNQVGAFGIQFCIRIPFFLTSLRQMHSAYCVSTTKDIQIAQRYMYTIFLGSL